MALLAIIAIEEGVRLWFWLSERYSATFNNTNAELFSNIVTPIATIISASLFAVLAFRQNHVIRSQNLKANFEKQTDKLIERLKDKYDYGLTGFELQMKLIYAWEVKFDTHFRNDYKDIEEGNLKPREYYENRTYSEKVKGLFNCFLTCLPHFEPILVLLRNVNESGMTIEDIRFLKHRIQTELINGFMASHQFIVTSQDEIPVIYFEINNPKADLYSNTILFTYFEKFDNALKNDS